MVRNRILEGLLIWGTLPCFLPVCNAKIPRRQDLDESLPIHIRIYNYAGIADGQLSAGQKIADHILGKAGIHTTWQDCLPRIDQNRSTPSCDDDLSKVVLSVYLVERLERTFPSLHRNALGFSIIPKENEGATMAYVGYPRLCVLASSISFRAEELLGLAMAHELGHLLLGTNAHSNHGIMRATWRRRDLYARYWEEFEFTQEQTKRLRAAVLSRILLHDHPEAATVEPVRFSVR